MYSSIKNKSFVSNNLFVFLGVGLLAVFASLMVTVPAKAAPTGTADVSITGQGALYKEVRKPVNFGVTATITPEIGATTLKPLMNAKLNLPSSLLFSASSSDPTCTAITPANTNFPPETAKSLCPKSIVGDGTAALYLAQNVAARIDDPVITVFNGGKDNAGNGVIKIHAYSAATNTGILMTGALKNGVLNVAIPRLTADSSVPTFNINIPGTIGTDKSFASAKCTGSYTSSAVYTLGNRDAAGTVTNEETISTVPSNQACTGYAGKPSLQMKNVVAPKKVKKGKKGTFKITVKNAGTATAKNIKLTLSGASKGSAKAGNISPGGSKTLKVMAKVKGKKGKKVSVTLKITGNNTPTKVIKRKVKIV